MVRFANSMVRFVNGTVHFVNSTVCFLHGTLCFAGLALHYIACILHGTVRFMDGTDRSVSSDYICMPHNKHIIPNVPVLETCQTNSLVHTSLLQMIASGNLWLRFRKWLLICKEINWMVHFTNQEQMNFKCWSTVKQSKHKVYFNQAGHITRIQFCSNEGPHPISRGDNKEWLKIYFDI